MNQGAGNVPIEIWVPIYLCIITVYDINIIKDWSIYFFLSFFLILKIDKNPSFFFKPQYDYESIPIFFAIYIHNCQNDMVKTQGIP